MPAVNNSPSDSFMSGNEIKDRSVAKQVKPMAPIATNPRLICLCDNFSHINEPVPIPIEKAVSINVAILSSANKTSRVYVGTNDRNVAP